MPLNKLAAFAASLLGVLIVLVLYKKPRILLSSLRFDSRASDWAIFLPFAAAV